MFDAHTGSRRRALALLLLSLALGLPASGCAPITLKLTMSVESNANANAPVQVSIIVVYEKTLVEKLLKLTAQQWFAQREQLLSEHPKDMYEGLWEFVPGQPVPPITLTL